MPPYLLLLLAAVNAPFSQTRSHCRPILLLQRECGSLSEQRTIHKVDNRKCQHAMPHEMSMATRQHSGLYARSPSTKLLANFSMHMNLAFPRHAIAKYSIGVLANPTL